MIFIKVFQKLSQFSGKVPLEHWVSRVAVNTCLNQIESEKVRPELRNADLSEEERAVVENLALPPKSWRQTSVSRRVNWSNICLPRSNRSSGLRLICYTCRGVQLKKSARSLAGARRWLRCARSELGKR